MFNEGSDLMQESANARRVRAARFARYLGEPWCGPSAAKADQDSITDKKERLRSGLLGHSVRARKGVPQKPTRVDHLTINDCKSEYHPETMVTDATVKFEVDAERGPFRIAELAAQLDPRRWAELCRQDGWTTSDPVTMEQGVPVPIPVEEREQPGDSFKGLLHEVFEVRWSEGLFTFCRFDVVLAVNYKVSAKKIDFRYNLHMPIRSKMFQRVQPGGLDVDSGYLEVTEKTVRAQKRVRFTEMTIPGGSSLIPGFASSPLNVTAPATVSLGLHEGLLHAFQAYL